MYLRNTPSIAVERMRSVAIIKCPECHNPVSDTCEDCIHCGYKLTQTDNLSESKIVAGHEVCNQRSSKKRILLIVTPLVAAVVILTLIFAIGNRSNDIFEKLYYGPPREQVLKELGQPDNSRESKGEIWCDIYEKVEFRGETGKLTVYYRGSGCVTGAEFEVIWPKADSTSKEQAHKYADDIAKYYSQKYGPQKNNSTQFSTSSDFWPATNDDKVRVCCTTNFSGDWVVSLDLN